MAGGHPPHNIIAANVTAALVVLTRGRDCVAMTSDQRVHVPATGLYAYPDVTVACGERRYSDDDPPSLLNPAVLVEITADSTEDFDRGKKFLHHQAMTELRDYIIVSHREQRIDHFYRLEDGGWHLATLAREDGAAQLPVLGGALAMAEVHAGVVLDEGRR